MKSQILADAARSSGDLKQAAQVCQQALRVGLVDVNGDGRPDSGMAPDDKALQEVRRRLVDLDLKLIQSPDLPVRERPLSSARDMANALIEQAGGEATSEDRVRLAHVLQAQAVLGEDNEARQEALGLLEDTRQRDPDNIEVARELAAMYITSTPPRPRRGTSCLRSWWPA